MLAAPIGVSGLRPCAEDVFAVIEHGRRPGSAHAVAAFVARLVVFKPEAAVVATVRIWTFRGLLFAHERFPRISVLAALPALLPK